MTELLEVKPGDRVLEIGTGSGYQAAVLSELTPNVYTIEIVKELGRQATERLKKLGYETVQVRVGDGYFGWEEHGPFDGIIVTCAAGHVPPPLLRQLKNGGRMVIPIGEAYEIQHLVVVSKNESGKITTRQVLPVGFVPMTGRIQGGS
jgi:protein-L-isoaspartate(D-aspartate) O-methyltransferase